MLLTIGDQSLCCLKGGCSCFVVHDRMDGRDDTEPEHIRMVFEIGKETIGEGFCSFEVNE